ncbi:pentapeptide repeat-containing protein [Micromonospora foliorum]|uniref:pentapeptide repeat-containing protein n=1 Tax=Micromonospora foliorum TaxID=2911210 RepID=UPI001EE94775|nr:pentapeptide repeat-containing protein [Micromonospora foliorum]MCG5440714.1 pentapeptide repeat-containing protein [Micromonospora foliorum]
MNSVRQTLLQTAAGIVALVALVVTVSTYRLSRRGQLTDRYLKVVALLASEKMHERIGGVFAAEQIMVESEKDHQTIVEVLSSFVREWPGHEGYPDDRELPKFWGLAGRRKSDVKLPADVQAALTVLGRRPARLEVRALDLTGADLRNANLREFNFRNASLVRAMLDDADLFGADLTWANLHDASLAYADLRMGTLRHAYMVGCTLRGAWLPPDMRDVYLVGSDCSGANFGENLEGAQINDCCLDRANLLGCNLANTGFATTDARNTLFALGRTADPNDIPARGMTAAQLERVAINSSTVLPYYLDPSSVGILVEEEGPLDWGSLDPIFNRIDDSEAEGAEVGEGRGEGASVEVAD